MLLCSVCCRGREDSPGHRECDSSIQQINRYIHDLDQASLSAAGTGGLRGDFPGSVQSYQEQVLNSARQLLDHIDPIRMAAKGEGDNLPHLVRLHAGVVKRILGQFTFWINLSRRPNTTYAHKS